MAFNLGSVQKDIKKIKGVSTGFKDPSTWIDTGNYALNFRMTNSFNKGIPLGKVTVFAGESGAGKSYLAGSIIKKAQEQGIHTVIIDSESAMDGKWLTAVGVKYITEEGATADDLPEGVGQVIRAGVTMINDVATVINRVMTTYKADVDAGDTAKLLFVIDSLGALQSAVAVDQFEKGDMKGDFGHKPRQLKALIMNCINMFSEYDVGMIATNHTYPSQDQFNPDPVISGGGGPIYAASIVLAMGKFKSKFDQEGNKTTKVTGIRARAKIMKTRFSKPFEEVNMRIPYPQGMDQYSGLFDLFIDIDVLKKPSGNKWIYTDLAGIDHKYFEKGYNNNTDGILDLIMSEFDPLQHAINNLAEEDEEEDVVDNSPAPTAAEAMIKRKMNQHGTGV